MKSPFMFQVSLFPPGSTAPSTGRTGYGGYGGGSYNSGNSGGGGGGYGGGAAVWVPWGFRGSLEGIQRILWDIVGYNQQLMIPSRNFYIAFENHHFNDNQLESRNEPCSIATIAYQRAQPWEYNLGYGMDPPHKVHWNCVLRPLVYLTHVPLQTYLGWPGSTPGFWENPLVGLVGQYIWYNLIFCHEGNTN